MSSRMTNEAENPADSKQKTGHHVCPWWVGYLLASPLRRLVENPDKLLAPYARPGMTVLDIGCAMGFFSLPLARLVGPGGRVVCVDVQERMLRVLDKRAKRKGLADIIETRPCTQENLNLEDLRDQVDLVVAFHVVHESLYPERFLEECFSALRAGGKLILAEPPKHIGREFSDQIFALPAVAGFVKQCDLDVRKSRAAVFEKPENGE